MKQFEGDTVKKRTGRGRGGGDIVSGDRKRYSYRIQLEIGEEEHTKIHTE